MATVLLTCGLGLGVAMTVASSWLDRARADAQFGTGELVVQVRTEEGQAWEEARWGARANRLNYAVTVADLRPGTTAYAPLSLRTAPGSAGGTVTLGPGVNRGSTTLFSALEYGVVSVAEPECGPGATGASVVAPGSPLDTVATGSVELAPDSEEPVHLCFAVTLPDESPDGDGLGSLRTTVQWQLDARPSRPDGPPAT